MADNVNVTAGSGTTIAADEVVDVTLGTVKVQYVKLMDGTLDGTSKAAVGANGLAVDGSGVTQPISGSVSVSNFPATQPVSGPLTDTQLRATAVPVSGTFWQATQPVSATSLPLPSGASTETTLAAAKTDLDKFTFVATRLLVDGSGVTQPVSGTFWQSTQPVSATSLPLPSGAATAALQTQPGVDIGDVTINNASGVGAVNIQDGGNSITVDGTVAVTQPVAVTDNSGSLTVDNGGTFAVQAAQSGTWNVGLNTGSNTIGKVDQGAAGATAWPVDATPASPIATDYLPVRITDGSTFKDPTQIRTLTSIDTVSVLPVNNIIKGTQNLGGWNTQDLKDAGRSYLSFTANAAAGVTSEALLSFTQNKQGATTASVTSYTITNGKTLRITSISLGLKSAAAAVAFAKIILRHNTAGATTTASPIAYLVPEVNTNSATSGTGAWITVPIPDGLEFFGNGTQSIGVSHLDSATTNVLNVTLYGFEY